MGVFARLLRRSKATEEKPAEAQTDKATAGTEAEETAGAGAEAAKGAEGAAEAAESATEAAEVTETEGVDIPKQQSTDKAADNEAGEGART
ncbi:hypothetical protein ACH49O_39000 [Streptomyces coeruleorubidus]|jgi:hypothetical protein|uniref:hypothetical protein n=1 Tax=Streptomyces coeruleorubidus TaxID=116188 RepID=UPI0033B4B2FA